MKHLEPRLVRYFLAVADLGSFSAAAAALHIAQPALSRQLRQFERFLGFDLFCRIPGAAQLTPEGRRLISPARKLQQATAHFAGEAAELRSVRGSRLRLGESHYALLSTERNELLADFAKARPDIAVESRRSAQAQLLDQCASHDVDLCLYTDVEPPDHKFEILPLQSCAAQLLVPVRHALARLPRVPHGALRGQTVAIMGAEHWPLLHELLYRLLRNAGALPRVPAETDLLALAAYAAHRRLIAVAPVRLTLPDFARRRLTWRPMDGLDVEMQTFLVRPRGGVSVAAQAFWDHARRRAGPPTAPVTRDGRHPHGSAASPQSACFFWPSIRRSRKPGGSPMSPVLPCASAERMRPT